MDPQHQLDERRRSVQFRAWRRGMREMDLLLGPFADATVATMGEADLRAFEALLELPDPDLYGWIGGGEPVPKTVTNAILPAVIAFHAERTRT
jgi:antitoxin CptB